MTNELLPKSNFSIEDVGFAHIQNDQAIISHIGNNLQNLTPRSYRWSTVVQHFPYFRFYLMTAGSMRIQMNNTELNMQSGFMYLIPPLSIKSAAPAEFSKHYFTHFNMRPFYNFIENYQISNCLPWDEQDLALNQILLDNYHLHTIESDLKAQGAFLMLLSKFFRNITAPSKDAQRFFPVLQYITQHINQNIQIEDLASLMHINKIYFTSLFSQTFSTPPLKFILEKRMLLAQELLMTTSLSVREISEQLGYDNEYYFSTTFKRVVGISPMKWKKLYHTKQ